jgi:hypothetical protein
VRFGNIKIVNLITESAACSGDPQRQREHSQLFRETLVEANLQHDAAIAEFVIAQSANTQTSQTGLSILEFDIESWNVSGVLLSSNASLGLTALYIVVLSGRCGEMHLLWRYGIAIDPLGRTALLILLLKSMHVSGGDELTQNFILAMSALVV